MSRTRPLVLSLGLLGLARVAAAQTGPAADAEEDLEIPAAPAAAPPAGGATPAPGSAPAEVSAPPPAGETGAVAVPSPSPETSAADAARIAELERRLAALEAKPAAPAPSTAPTDVAKRAPASAAQEPVNLERAAHSRQVASGLVIGGYLHAQLEHHDISEDQLFQSGTPKNQDRFVLRRGRLRVDRGWDYAGATLELDANTTSGADVGVRRAEGSVFYRGSNTKDLPPLVMLSAGATDLPFGYELYESARVRVFMERSLASSALFPTEMDVGLKVSGAVSFLRYGVALSTGEPVDDEGFSRDPNAAKELTGRIGAVVPIGEALELGFGTSFAKGKGFHPGKTATKATVIWRDDDQNGVVTGPGEFVGIPGTAAEASENFERFALGFDLGASLRTALGETHLYGEAYAGKNYDRGFLVSDPVAAPGVDVRQLGGYVALTQEITPYGIVGLRYSAFDPNSDVFEKRRGEFEPKTQTIRTVSPVVGVALPKRARLTFQYDVVDDYLARDGQGVPTDADNDVWTARLQVEL